MKTLINPTGFFEAMLAAAAFAQAFYSAYAFRWRWAAAKASRP